MDYKSAALIMMAGETIIGKAETKYITANGTYEPDETQLANHIIGFNPIVVYVPIGSRADLSTSVNGIFDATEIMAGTDNVGYRSVNVNVSADKSNIHQLTISEPGTYYAADYGWLGFDPVILTDKYVRLIKYLDNGGDTNTTDDGIDVENSMDTGNTDNTNLYLSAGDFDTVTNSGNSVEIKFWVEKTPHPTQDKYWTLTYYYTATNLNTGDTVEGRCYSVSYGWNEATTKQPLFKIDSIEYGSSICTITYSFTRYNEDGTVRDTVSGYRSVDHGSVNASTYTDHWIVSDSTT